MISYDIISYDMIAAAAPRLKQVQRMENQTFFSGILTLKNDIIKKEKTKFFKTCLP